MIRSPYSAMELRWAEAALDIIYPSAPELGFPLGIRDLGVGAFMQDIRRRVPAQTAIGIRAAIWIIAFAPIFVIGRLGTIASIGRPERARVLDVLLDSPIYAIRQLVTLFKVTGALLYGGDPRIRARVGFPPQSVEVDSARPLAISVGPAPLVQLHAKSTNAANERLDA